MRKLFQDWSLDQYNCSLAFCGVLRLRDAGNVLTKTVKLYLYHWKNGERTKILEEVGFKGE